MPSIAEVLRKAYGEVEARLLEETSQRCIHSLESHVEDFRPDLSRIGSAPAAK